MAEVELQDMHQTTFKRRWTAISTDVKIVVFTQAVVLLH